MPSAADFRRHFGLTIGSAVGSSLCINASHVGHVVERQNERYSFPIELVLSGGGAKASPKSVASAFASHARAKQHGIVHSAYGSPYECTVSCGKAKPSSEDGGWTLTTVGQAVRRRDLPTLVQQHAVERTAKEPGKEALAGLQPEYRVIRSRFGTSKCGLCGDTIEPGTSIAKREGEQGRGGWAHASCVLRKRVGGGGGRRLASNGSGGGKAEKKAAVAKGGIRKKVAAGASKRVSKQHRARGGGENSAPAWAGGGRTPHGQPRARPRGVSAAAAH